LMGNNTIVRIGLAVPCPKPPVVAAVAAAVAPAPGTCLMPISFWVSNSLS